jgi:hypothetical protein
MNRKIFLDKHWEDAVTVQTFEEVLIALIEVQSYSGEEGRFCLHSMGNGMLEVDNSLNVYFYDTRDEDEYHDFRGTLGSWSEMMEVCRLFYNGEFDKVVVRIAIHQQA